MAKKKERRCAGCGKTFESGQKAYSVQAGVIGEDLTMSAEKLWGEMHKSCFEHSIESPQTVLQEVKRLAKSNRE